jgi:hypothetical protein
MPARSVQTLRATIARAGDHLDDEIGPVAPPTRACWAPTAWQVFWLGCHPSERAFPRDVHSQWHSVRFDVDPYSGGAAPDSHRVP